MRIANILENIHQMIGHCTVGIVSRECEEAYSYAVAPNDFESLQKIRDAVVESSRVVPGQDRQQSYFANMRLKDPIVTRSIELKSCEPSLPVAASLIILHRESQQQEILNFEVEIDTALSRLAIELSLIKHRFSVVWHRDARSTLIKRQSKALAKIVQYFASGAVEAPSKLKKQVADDFCLVSRICGFDSAQEAFRAGETGRFLPFYTI